MGLYFSKIGDVGIVAVNGERYKQLISAFSHHLPHIDIICPTAKLLQNGELTV